jgi:transcriptional regulator with PAS, ATPase and Fis domain
MNNAKRQRSPDLIGAKRQRSPRSSESGAGSPDPIGAERQPLQDKLRPDYFGDEKISIGLEVWQRVFNWRIYQQTLSLLRQIFKRSFGVGNFEAMGITPEEYERIRGPLKEPGIPFPFCEFINGTEEGKRRCTLEMKQSVARASSTGKTDIWTCHAGLTDLSVPFIFHGTYCGRMCTWGGLLLDEPNETHWQEIAGRVKDTGVDLERLKKAYFEIAPISKELLEVMLNLMSVVVEEVIKAVVEVEEDKKRISELESALADKYNFDKIIGKSRAMQEIFSLIRRIIPTDSPVLIEGETGTGKELVASTIHYNGPRKDKSFMAINCGGMTETLLESELFGHIKGSFTGAIRDKKGLFEVTDKGTLFLDEIGEMSPSLQVKLLRVLQEGIFLPVGATEPRKADVRIISATNKNLKELVSQGKIREDLYYRINVIKVTLPPLRNRKDDIPLLIDHFLKTFPAAAEKNLPDPSERGSVRADGQAGIQGIRTEAMKMLLNYSWPGNIRELQNVLQRAISLAGSRHITPEDLPEELIKKREILPSIDIHRHYEVAKKNILDSFQKEYFSKILVETQGNIREAARQSGISRTALKSLLKKHHLRAGDFKD